jgi:hypothetical protein
MTHSLSQWESCPLDSSQQVVRPPRIHTFNARSRPQILYLGGPNEDAHGKHNYAAKHDLENRLEKRSVHITCANVGDCP